MSRAITSVHVPCNQRYNARIIRLREIGSIVVKMGAFVRAAAIRLGVGIVGAGAGVLTGFVGQAVWTCRDNYSGSTSAAICAAFGAGFGFLAGVCLGNRSLAGRPAI